MYVRREESVYVLVACTLLMCAQTRSLLRVLINPFVCVCVRPNPLINSLTLLANRLASVTWGPTVAAADDEGAAPNVPASGMTSTVLRA